jgi:hypothetical protein
LSELFRGSLLIVEIQAKNDSEYTLLKGVASIYVDGSFISRSDVPTVSPQETFDSPLGYVLLGVHHSTIRIDPSIRITYHPRSKKINRSGFTCSYTFDQRITVVNTKATSSLSSIKIQIPVSENEKIVVHLLDPALQLPTVSKKGNTQRVCEERERSPRHRTEIDEEDGGIDPTLGAQVFSRGAPVQVRAGA